MLRLYMFDRDLQGRFIVFNEQRTVKLTATFVAYRLEVVDADGNATIKRGTVDVRELTDPLTQRSVALGIANVVEKQLEAGL